MPGSGPTNVLLGRATASGTVTAYPLKAGASYAAPMAGPDGRLWFAEQSQTFDGRSFQITQKIDRLDPATGVIERFALPRGNQDGLIGQPPHLTAGPDGAIWFTDAANDAIGRITAGTIREYPLATPKANPADIVHVSGQLWFTEPGFESHVGQVVRVRPA